MSRSRPGASTCTSRPSTSGSLIEQVAGASETLVRQHGNTLELRLADDLGLIRSDSTKVRQVLFNLLSNGRQLFTGARNHPRDARREEVDGRPWVAVAVTDTGIGIAPSTWRGSSRHSRQVDASISRRFGGTGLGLAITQHYCRLLGGRVTWRAPWAEARRSRRGCRPTTRRWRARRGKRLEVWTRLSRRGPQPARPRRDVHVRRPGIWADRHR